MIMRRYRFTFLNLFWFLIIAYISYVMPYYVDDYQHRLSFFNGETITGIGQIFPSVFEYYLTWGGRIVSMFFIQLMLMLPRLIYAGCNGIVYVLVANTIYSYATYGKKQKSACGLAIIYLFMWFFMPDFAEVITWPTGTITYLWTNGIILAFGYLYYKDYCDQKREGGKLAKGKAFLLCIGYFLLGFLSGQSNEAGASTIIFALMVFFAWKIKKHYKVAVYQLLGAGGAFIGFLTLILAPGNRERVQAVSDAADNTNILLNYAYRIGRESFYAMMYLLIPFAIALALYVIRRNSISKFDKFKTLCFMAFALVSVYVMTFSAGFANRVFQLPLILITISMAISMTELLRTDATKKIKKGIAVFSLVMMVMAVFEVTAGMLYSHSRDSFFDRQVIYYHIYDTQGAVSGNGI